MCNECTCSNRIRRYECNERNYTSFKLAEYAVKNYDWFFTNNYKDADAFNDYFVSIFYANKLHNEALDRYSQAVSDIVYDILKTNPENGLDKIIDYRCKLLDIAMKSIKENFPHYKEEFIGVSYNRYQFARLVELVENFKIYTYDNGSSEDAKSQALKLVSDVAKECPFIFIKINSIFNYTRGIYDNIELDKTESQEVKEE